MDREVLLVSPHPDDVAWSLGRTVTELRRLGVRPHVLTLFTRTRYAPGSPAHGTSDASAVREAEEVAWAELAGVTLHRCELPDASLRGFDDDTEMGAPPEPDVVGTVTDLLRDALSTIAPGLVLAPLAAGGHIDHEAVRRATVALCAGPELLWYEDLPYADEAAPGRTEHPLTLEIAEHWPAIEAAVRCFPSQEPEDILPVIRRHRVANGGERLWAATGEAEERYRRLLRMGTD
jgi:LmbE family N-acetylglucosaminyl deacetylase